ncbi:MAG: DUF364 domain-containing protein [Syntrophaceae bacterium]|nr:DUF364 domain-containing protein [Syntrophaceae bacterium]
MHIADTIKNHVRQHCAESRITDVRMGLGYTGVCLDDGGCGVAFTFKEGLYHGCSVFTGKRPLVGKSSHELVDYFGSSSLLESTLGLSTINALFNRAEEAQFTGDVMSMLDLKAEDRVGMVGYFGPLLNPLREKVRELLIFEIDEDRADEVMPAELAYEELAHCDIAIITSTSLINGTTEGLLDAARNCREIVLLGASTPLIPEVFKPLGVTLLSGVQVVDIPAILRVLSEGGGMAYFGKAVRKVAIRL